MTLAAGQGMPAQQRPRRRGLPARLGPRRQLLPAAVLAGAVCSAGRGAATPVPARGAGTCDAAAALQGGRSGDAGDSVTRQRIAGVSRRGLVTVWRALRRGAHAAAVFSRGITTLVCRCFPLL